MAVWFAFLCCYFQISIVLGKGKTTEPEPMPSSEALDGCWQAYESCDFDFLDTAPGIKRFALGEPGLPFTPQIISRNASQTVGIANANGISQEIILEDGQGVDLDRVGKPKLGPLQFKPTPLTSVMGSAITYDQLSGNQFRLLRRSCLRVHFTEYQLLMSSDPPMVMNVAAARGTGSCVVFITQMPEGTVF